MSFMQNNLSTVERGALGTFTSIGSAALSTFSHLETALRIGGLLIGICVGVATLISVLHDIRKKRKENQ
jgi:hypothetical protein